MVEPGEIPQPVVEPVPKGPVQEEPIPHVPLAPVAEIDDNKLNQPVAPKEEVKKEEKPASEADLEKPTNEDNLDDLLDTIASFMPKDLSKNLSDTSKMEIFSDINEPVKEEKKEQPIINAVKQTKGPVKEQIVKKVVVNPDGSKKIVTVKRIVSAAPKDGDAPVASNPAKKVVKSIGGQSVKNDLKPINKIAKQKTEEENV